MKHKLKFYILTSSNLECLKRHNSFEWTELPIEDTVIVINTLNTDYIEKAVDYCRENNIEYYVTESNGTPAKGKNSVFDLFLNSDNDYCVLIDGDDMLTPHGVWLYKHLANLDSPPDAVGLKKQIALMKYNGKLFNHKPFTCDYNKLLSLNLTKELHENYNLSLSKSKRFDDYNKKYFRCQQLYSEKDEMHCRVVFFSKKAAKFKFNETVKVGEDTLQMLRLKHESLENNLKFLINDERPCTYIYDERTVGIVKKTSNLGTNYNWMNTYLKKLSEMRKKNFLHKYTYLKELKINYPKDYIAEDYGLKSCYTHKINNCKFKFPKNASKTSLNKAYKYYSLNRENI